ncbi:MAG: segregation/condensation protein A [Cyanobacteria bacterium SBLK]|nr:segregation/condensation protein A [Cyanobacteria bacterium SBLK]
MTQNFAKEAIAVLLDLAQQGEIDPWNVNVVEAIDLYLSKISLTATPDPERETADLPQSGQAFLWASTLILLKANTLEQLGEEEEEEEEFLSEELDPRERALPLRLEKHIRRRPSAPPLRRRRVTLNELIEQIQEMAAVLETKAAQPRKKRTQSRKEAARHISQLAHNENLTEMAGLLEAFFENVFPQLAGDRDLIDLNQLVAWWSDTQPEEKNYPIAHHRVGVFWALLLLSAQSKVELSQTEFYQDLTIKPLINSPTQRLG